MSKLKEKLMLSEKGYSDLKKAITACTITNIALLLPSMVACLIFWELLKPFTGEAISWAALWKLLGLGLVAAILVFLAVSVLFKGDLLTSIFTTEKAVILQGYAYLKGFALETIVTAVLFSMVGYFNGHYQTVWVMVQGLIQTLLVRLPLSYYMSIQPHANLTNIGLAAPIATIVGIILNVCFYIYLSKKMKKENA